MIRLNIYRRRGAPLTISAFLPSPSQAAEVERRYRAWGYYVTRPHVPPPRWERFGSDLEDGGTIIRDEHGKVIYPEPRKAASNKRKERKR